MDRQLPSISATPGSTSTIYIPIEGPPTPGASPALTTSVPYPNLAPPPLSLSPSSSSPSPMLASSPPEPTPAHVLILFSALPATQRTPFLTSLLPLLAPHERTQLASLLTAHTTRDFLGTFPTELALHVLRFVQDPRDLVRAGTVSKRWRVLARDEWVWRRMCGLQRFWVAEEGQVRIGSMYSEDLGEEDGKGKERNMDADRALLARDTFDRIPLVPGYPDLLPAPAPGFSYRSHFKAKYIRHLNWLKSGRLLRSHRTASTTNAPSPPRAPHHHPHPHPSSVPSTNTHTSTSTSTTSTTTATTLGLPTNAHTRTHNPWGSAPPVASSNSGSAGAAAAVVTSLALDAEHLVVGLASWKIHIFSARTGALERSLLGHEGGVWGVWLVSAGGEARSKESSKRAGNGKIPEVRSTSTEARGGGGWIWDGDDEDEEVPAREHLVPPPMRTALGLDLDLDFSPRRCRPPPDPDTEEDGGDGGEEDDQEDADEEEDDEPSDPCGASRGWGQPGALVVSGGCDKVVRVWDVQTGICIYALPGHTSTIRCLKVLPGRPIAVSGARDATLRVWDVRRGRCLRVLRGHLDSVRSVDVCGGRAVSGSYDRTVRLWDIYTGECLHVLTGHYHQIYSVVFDGDRIASGGMDATVRVWDAHTGKCVALLQGHTALVSHLQIFRNTLATSGSDGRVITFALPPYWSGDGLSTALGFPFPTPTCSSSSTNTGRPTVLLSSTATSPSTATTPHRPRARNTYPTSPTAPPPFSVLRRIAAHDSSVTSLQLTDHFIVTGSNDGRVRLFDAHTGSYVRDLTDASEGVWKVLCRADRLVVACKRGGKTVVEIWGF